MKLYKREITDQIVPYLDNQTVVVLHGARQVGKTHILYWLRDYLQSKNQNVFYYDLEYPQLLSTCNLGVEAFVQDLLGRGYQSDSLAYVLIDEIQYLDNPSSFLKIIADHYPQIHLIVTGSSSFDIKTKFTDSLVGRTTNFEIYPLSFAEFLDFREVAIRPTSSSPAIVHELTNLYTEFVLYGGYPQIVLEPVLEKKTKQLLQIIDTYVRKDIRDLADIDDISKFNNLIRLLAHQSGSQVNYASLCSTCRISYPTLQKYLNILEETYIIKLVHPYSKSPDVEISKAPKIFFFDSGLQSLLWLDQFSVNLQGNIFETNIFSELVKKYGRSDIRYWRTKNGTEVDFVLNNQSRPLAIEVKSTFPAVMPAGVGSFLARYQSADSRVVSLLGMRPREGFVYPWELDQLTK